MYNCHFSSNGIFLHWIFALFPEWKYLIAFSTRDQTKEWKLGDKKLQKLSRKRPEDVKSVQRSPTDQTQSYATERVRILQNGSELQWENQRGRHTNQEAKYTRYQVKSKGTAEHAGTSQYSWREINSVVSSEILQVEWILLPIHGLQAWSLISFLPSNCKARWCAITIPPRYSLAISSAAQSN